MAAVPLGTRLRSALGTVALLLLLGTAELLLLLGTEAALDTEALPALGTAAGLQTAVARPDTVELGTVEQRQELVQELLLVLGSVQALGTVALLPVVQVLLAVLVLGTVVVLLGTVLAVQVLPAGFAERQALPV